MVYKIAFSGHRSKYKKKGGRYDKRDEVVPNVLLNLVIKPAREEDSNAG